MAPFTEAEITDGRITALRLADGTRAEADLFVDATGTAARLIGGLGDRRGSWRAWLLLLQGAQMHRHLIGRPQFALQPCLQDLSKSFNF